MANLKKHKSLSDQVELLKQRGLIIQNDREVAESLFNINYYRISGYLHDFKKTGCDCYVDNLSWSRLKQIYDFDRKLTRLLMFALEDIEETLKSRLSYTITSHYPDDPIIYLKPTIYRNYAPYISFLDHFYKEKSANSSLPFVQHHDLHYGGLMPMWAAVEILTMGNLHAVYDNLIPKYQKDLARSYNTGPRQLSSWIENLTYTRNHLAHYMRIYNFNFGRSPAKCYRHPAYTASSNMIFDQIFVMACMYSDISEWQSYIIPEIGRLLDEYHEDINLDCIGFPTSWEHLLYDPTRSAAPASVKNYSRLT